MTDYQVTYSQSLLAAIDGTATSVSRSDVSMMLELYERTLTEKRTYRDEVQRLSAELAKAKAEIEHLKAERK